MELLETFTKYEISLDQSCKKNEKLFFDLKDELNIPEELNIELNLGAQGGNQTMEISQYLQNFIWNDIKFMMKDKSLGVLGANVANVQKSLDDKLKKKLDEQSLIKTKLQGLTKKAGNTLNQKDLADCVYEKLKDVGKGRFIQSNKVDGENYSQLLTTILVVVGKKKVEMF